MIIHETGASRDEVTEHIGSGIYEKLSFCVIHSVSQEDIFPPERKKATMFSNPAPTTYEST